MATPRPENVGILAIDIYVPPSYVSQSDLEQFDGVSAGKYTIGLGQEAMAFCCDQEDVISMSLTAVQSLLEKHAIDPSKIGRIEVGSETVIDKSKSIKTAIMTLFEAAGNADVEGVDSTNACYGGTAALLNCINWVESSSWDGRYALAVASDSAVYAEGAARPTGGAGAVAMLVGANAPLTFESGLSASHCQHAYDFYKPRLASEYPVVDGKLSQSCYISAVDNCFKGYCGKFKQRHGSTFTLADSDYLVFHSPYNKLVQKSTARLVFQDLKRSEASASPYLSEADVEALKPFLSLPDEQSLSDRDLEKAAVKASKGVYSSKVVPGAVVPQQVGNMYCASVYGSLASLVANKGTELEGKRVLVFSYGSGLMSTLFSFKVSAGAEPFTLQALVDNLNVTALLDSRTKVEPAEFAKIMHLMESRYGASDFVPEHEPTALRPGTFYLTRVDDLFRRSYARKDKASPVPNGIHVE